MNTTEESDATPRPLAYWLRAIGGLLARRTAEAFDAEGVDHREGMLLIALSRTERSPWLAERLARGGKRVRSLAERGWIVRDGDDWTLTDEGRAAAGRLSGAVDGLREEVAESVSGEDFDTTLRTLEALARELGWDESRAGARGWGSGGRGRGFAPGRFGSGFGPGFGPGAFGPGFGRGFAPGFGPRHGYDPRHGHPHAHGYGHGERCASHGERGRGHRHDERTYERGFEAGFSRGRETAASGPSV